VPSPLDTDHPYPRFSRREMHRRRRAMLGAMRDSDVGHLLVYGANRFGSAVQWLTGWPVTREALVVVGADDPDVLLVQFYNHVPNARILAPDSEVRWGGTSTIETAIQEVRRREGRSRVGTIGPFPASYNARLSAEFGDVVELDRAYTRMRRIKSQEELEWVRVGAELTDRAIDAILEGVKPGVTEVELGDLVERAYVPAGGTTLIHYFGTTSMVDPDRCVPAQWPSTRGLRPGDVLTTEISAAFWDYPGQILRTFTIAADPTPLYQELHAVARDAFDAVVSVLRHGTHAAEVVEAASVIEEAGFTTYDDLVHGFVGGYLPPVLRSRSSALSNTPNATFEAGMTVVVQPNVITPDTRAGVQTGELVLITDTGVERLHRSKLGPFRVAD
jgi:Xaa-Pro aminopeptidase